jgi:hypothetical protein
MENHSPGHRWICAYPRERRAIHGTATPETRYKAHRTASPHTDFREVPAVTEAEEGDGAA